MAKWVIDDSTLTDIADAIREKKGTVAPIAVDELADEVATISGGEDLYTKHIPTETNSYLAISSSKCVFMDILAKSDKVIAVSYKTTNSIAFINRATLQVTGRVSPCPLGADATDLPENMTDFYDSGNGFVCRSITESPNYYIVGIRYGGGIQVDGTHLYGGIVFVDKTTLTVTKSYWLPFIISRVVYNEDLNILAVGLQMAGLRFYSISGVTLTELETFTYDQSAGSSKKGCESQHGCFFTDGERQYYANVGFGMGVLFYDITDTSHIVEVGEFILKSYPAFNNSGVSIVHTYTGICKYPYLYLTIARADKVSPHYDLDGVLTLDISNLANAKVLNFEHINQADAVIYNDFGDTKPTEMTITHGMLYLNYENGYLAFEIDANGRSTHYCGKYQTTDVIYGIDATPESELFAGISGDTDGYVYQFMEFVSWSVYKSLVHVSINNTEKRVDNNSSYSATLTADNGYEISSVTVLMNGLDITSTAYNNGVITIANVTGDISISAIATETTNYYWQPSDATINQYQSSKPATITVNNNDISLEMSEYNSGFKTIKNITAPISDMVLTLKADDVVLSQPMQTQDCIFNARFLDSNDSKVKEYNFVSGTTAKYLDDIDDGISVNVRASDLVGAVKVQIALRGNANESSHYPISVEFTNLRIEVE